MMSSTEENAPHPIWLVGFLTSKRGCFHDYCFGEAFQVFYLLLFGLAAIWAILCFLVVAVLGLNQVTARVSMKEGARTLRPVLVFFNDRESKREVEKLANGSTITFSGILWTSPQSQEGKMPLNSDPLVLAYGKLEHSEMVVSPETRYQQMCEKYIRSQFQLPARVKEVKWNAYYANQQVQFKGRVTKIEETPSGGLSLTVNALGVTLVVSLTGNAVSRAATEKLSTTRENLFVGVLPSNFPAPSESLRVTDATIK